MEGSVARAGLRSRAASGREGRPRSRREGLARALPTGLAVGLATLVSASGAASRIDESEAFERVRSLPLAALEPGLPEAVELGRWLAARKASSSSLSWALDACGAPRGDAEAGASGFARACVTVRAELPDGATLGVRVRVGHLSSGLSGTPALHGVWTEEGGRYSRYERLRPLYERLAAPDERTRTLRLETVDCGVYEYDLAASGVGAAELRRLFELVGPDVASRRHVLPQIRRCLDESAAYWPCGERRPSSPHFFRNARVNLRRAERLIGEIRAVEHPELREAKRYLLRRYETWAALMERKRRVLRGEPLDVLLEPVAGLAIRERCRESVAELERFEGRPDALLDALKGWHNCVNHALHELDVVRRGYPRASWRRFLEAQRIEERVYREESCDTGVDP